MIIYTDETAVRVGESRGQIWVTRVDTEAYHEDCVDVRYRGYTELQFWAAYTVNLKGPCYMFGKETTADKEAAREDLAQRNADIDAQQQIVKEHFLAEQQKKPKSKRLKRVPKIQQFLVTALTALVSMPLDPIFFTLHIPHTHLFQVVLVFKEVRRPASQLQI